MLSQLADTTGSQDLRTILRDMRRIVVAYSGGVDSATLLAVAYIELGDDVLAVTGRSPSLASGELEAARALAERIGARHEIIDTREFDDPRYRRNDRDRCYHCKDELFFQLATIAVERGYDAVVDGFNADDGRSQPDVRPGHAAGLRRGVRSPLAEAGLGKEAIRTLARQLELPVWDKPATPCLSSRVPYGTTIELDDLRKIDLAERYLRALGFAIVRVRHFGATARIEVPVHRLADLSARQDSIERALRAVGYAHVEIDPRGYRTGSLNAG
jgi:uncharacterized protein